MLQLGVDLGGVGDGLADRSTQRLAEPPAEAVNGHPDRTFAPAEPKTELGVRGVDTIGETALERLELLGATGALLGGGESRQRAFEHGERPAPLVLLLGRPPGGIGGGEALLGDEEVEREGVEVAGAALRPPAIPLVGHEVAHRGEEEGAKPPALRRDLGQVAFLQEAEEVGLSQVGGLVGRVAEPADEGVERFPVGGAELFEGGVGS